MKDKNELEFSDFEISAEMFFVSANAIIAYVESWFDVDMKFGTNTRDSLNWVDVLVLYVPETGALKCVYFVNSEKSIKEEKEYVLTEYEKKLILEKMENTCQMKFKCSIEEVIQKEVA